jgi:hypothetical protein
MRRKEGHELRKRALMSITYEHTSIHHELAALLPGPDRKRTPKLYLYRLTFRSADSEASGCVMNWDVQGGRMPYQIAVERREDRHLRVHCTCADAVFRREQEGRLCKHVQGFLEETLRDVLLDNDKEPLAA